MTNAAVTASSRVRGILKRISLAVLALLLKRSVTFLLRSVFIAYARNLSSRGRRVFVTVLNVSFVRQTQRSLFVSCLRTAQRNNHHAAKLFVHITQINGFEHLPRFLLTDFRTSNKEDLYFKSLCVE